jgi:putative IMPACT (imprinted ancient) family translation regulator
MSDDDLDRQDEEIEILKAIYNENEEDCVISKVNQQGVRIVDIVIDKNITIRATLPSSYPSKDGPIFELLGRNIKVDDRTRAIDMFYSIYNGSGNDVVLFSCAEWTKQNLANSCDVDSQPTSSEHLEQVENIEPDACLSMIEASQCNDELISRIYHSDTLVDRKSVFQSHVAAISHPDEARKILSILKQDRKIARATHNIMAYRVLSEEPSSETAAVIVYADNDDDGEHGAGPKLAELLSLLGAKNLIVVVSRWYGGIQLGPDRFKHIANVARAAIEHCGLCARSDSSTSNSANSKHVSKKGGRLK